MGDPTVMHVPPLSGDARDELDRAILNYDTTTIRQVLRDVCNNSPEVSHVLHQALCIEPKPKTSTGKKRKLHQDVSSNSKRAKVRSRGMELMHFKERYKHCVNCYELFDILESPCHDHTSDTSDDDSDSDESNLGVPGYDPASDTADDDSDADESDSKDDEDAHDCRFHSGELEVDYDHYDWPDHDEDCHGTIDSDGLRAEYPECYIWSCCNQPGDASGCKGSRHRTGPRLRHFATLKEWGLD